MQNTKNMTRPETLKELIKPQRNYDSKKSPIHIFEEVGQTEGLIR